MDITFYQAFQVFPKTVVDTLLLMEKGEIEK